MKKVVNIVSDLWGIEKSVWVEPVRKELQNQYDVKFYDACELGEIDLSLYNENALHQQFVDFGIQKAVENLLSQKKDPACYIGCSVGGVIIWKAGLLGLPIQSLIAISSTRLRKEKQQPNCPIKLYFGAMDPYRPDAEWLDSMDCEYKILEGVGHHLYHDQIIMSRIIQDIK